MKTLFLTLVSLMVFNAHAGIVIGGTRFVYPQAAESITVDVKNTAATNYLVQTKISQRGDKEVFIATPPLMVVNGGHAAKIRLIRTGGDLPADRESLFYLTIAALPAGKPDANSLQIAVKSQMKLFYRPEGLQEGAAAAWKQLQWKTGAGHAEFSNPTAYYVTLSHLTLNGQTEPESHVLAPFSHTVIDGCPSSGPCQARWKILNDAGQVITPDLHL